MAYWDGSFGPPVEKWRWETKRVYNPFVRCSKNGKILLFKKAFYGRFYLDWEYDHDKWLSAEEYMIAVLRDEFQ